MDIHEYQAKELLSQFGLAVPKGALAYSPEQAAYRSRELGGERWVVKAQVHAGGRSQAGGIRLCHSDAEVLAASEALFGRKIVTRQTGERGRGVYRVYVEAAVNVTREIYLGLVLDRASQRVMIVASAEGGRAIEEIAAARPESLIRATVDPAIGLQDFQCREIGFALQLGPGVIQDFVRTLRGCYRAFQDLDATMIELNPLALTEDGRILALDAKMTFDDAALFRHPQISELRDKSQEDPREAHAADRGFSYLGLEGRIGILLNGAGMARATVEMLRHAGGEAACILDIGGGAPPERVSKAVRLMLSDERVEALLVNLFAGTNRCDWVAEGVVQALAETASTLPVVVRLAGNRAEEGQKVLSRSGLPIIRAATLAEAAERTVAVWKNDPARRKRA